MKKKSINVIWRGIIFFALSVASSHTLALCLTTPILVIQLLNSPSSISINPYAANGSVLYSGSFTGISGQFNTSCTSSFATITFQGNGTAVNNVYPTNITGIGIRMSNATGTTGPWPVSQNITPTTSYTTTLSATVNFELIKTGPIPATGILLASLGAVVLPQQGNFVIASVSLIAPMVINFTQPTCNVTSLPITVLMGIYSTSYFPTVGSTSIPVPFAFQVTCLNGPLNSTTRMYATFTDSGGANVGNTSQILSLNPLSNAAGVGIQIKYNGSIISYGPDSAVLGNLNQFLLGDRTNGLFNFPFTATMIRTGNMTTGVVIANATFTLSYQ